MVTRTKPLDISINSLDVENERFVIPVQFQVDSGGHAGFVSYQVDPDIPGVGNVMYLQGTGAADRDGNIKLSKEAVIKAVLASSAFPVAFGRVKLDY